MKINFQQPQIPTQKIAFNGSLRLLGEATPRIKQAFMDNKAFQELSEGKYDIVGRISSRFANEHEIYNEGRDDVLYRLSIRANRQNKNIFSKIINFFNFRVVKPSKNYHSEDTTIQIIKNLNNKDYLVKELGL